MAIVGISGFPSIIYCSLAPPCYECGEGFICKVCGLFELLDRDEEKL